MATPQPVSPGAQAQFMETSIHGDTSLDFLTFMGLDADQFTDSIYPDPALPPIDAGPSIEASGSRPNSTGEEHRQNNSGRGRTRTRTKTQRGLTNGKGIGARSTSSHRERMDVDVTRGTVQPFGPSQLLGMTQGMSAQSVNMELGSGTLYEGQEHGFDAAQASLLQQQLERIHMQTPISDPSNLHSPYHPMTNMWLASPDGSSIQDGAPEHRRQQGQHSEDTDQKASHQGGTKWRGPNGFGGIITPAPSGDMLPQARPAYMSPMQLETLARAEAEAHPELNMTPLLSPALSHQRGSSAYASPTSHTDFGYGANARSYTPNRSPLEQLQEQQRQFQEQLARLQQQQNDLQVAAAAVVAASVSTSASNSPLISGHMSSRHATTPGFNDPHSAGPRDTSSPGYFSPLTSPALEASSRSQHFGHHAYSRQPHPLSALSSPALNPVGSSGGAQQTLSPALEPQNNADLADPDYVRALVGLLEAQSQSVEGSSNTVYPSPSPSTINQHLHMSPLVGPNGTIAGPHRHVPSKTRPSPMMKPTNHRSHGRHNSIGGANQSPGTFSVPASPAIQRVASQAGLSGLGYLPPAALQSHHPNPATQMMQSSGSLAASTPSTPSPVDLSQMMPPPPVPVHGAMKGVTPLTPASLMNLGSGLVDAPMRTNNNTPMPSGPRKQVTAPTQAKLPARKGQTSVHTSTGSKKYGSSTAAKRSLAIRPPGSVGSRTVIKGAAAATSSHALPEGETRKTSHKAAEQKRRDSLKAGFDELRLLLPPINTEALDPESGEPIPGSSAPRLLPKSSLVPDDNPNRGVSKVALLRFGNEHIVRLHGKVDKRDGYIERLRDEVKRLRLGDGGDEVRGEEGEDLLEMDMMEGEEEDFGDPEDSEGEGEGDEDGAEADNGDEDDGMEEEEEDVPATRRKPGSWKKSPALNPVRTSIGRKGGVRAG